MLANILEYNGKKNKPQVNYQIELMDEHEEKCFEALNGLNIHKQKIKIDGFSLYKNQSRNILVLKHLELYYFFP